MNEINIQPSQYVLGGTVANQQYTQTPPPGVSNGPPAVSGVATCSNLLADSPPTLLEEFSIYDFSIPVGVAINAFSAMPVPTIQIGLLLLVNDRMVAKYTASPAFNQIGGGAAFVATQVFSGDLNNPIVVGARDRLGLQLSVNCNAATGGLFAAVGVRYDPTSNAFGFDGDEAKLFYNTINLPASRRL